MNVIMNEEKPSTRWSVLVVVVAVCFVGQSFARFSFGLLLPAMKTELKVSYGLAGWLGTINLAGYLVGTIGTSVSALRVPPHRIMQFGVALSTLAIAVLSFASSVPVLLAAMLVGGIGGAAAWIPSPVMAACAVAPKHRALAMGSASAAIGTGIVIATVLTRVLRSASDDPLLWRPIWRIEALIGVFATIAAFRVLGPIESTTSAPKLSVLKRVPRWWAPTIAYTFFGLGYVLFATFLVSALELDAGFSKAHAANAFALLGAGNAIGALTVGRVADRVGQRMALGSMFFLTGLACLAVLSETEPLVSVAAFAFGFGMAGSVVSITSYLGRTLAPQYFSSAFGVVTACFGVAQTIGPRLGGFIADSEGSFRWVFVLAAVCWFAGSAFSLAMPRRDVLARLATH